MVPASNLYKFSDNERVILVFQSVILSAAAFPIWLLARRHVGKILAIATAFLYLNFVGIQSVVAYDFHEMAILPFFLAFLFYFLDRSMWKSYFLTLVLCLAVREHIGLMLAVLSSFILLQYKNVKIALATFFISLTWSLVSIKVLMPALGQRSYDSFLMKDDSLGGAILTYITNPVLAFKNFFWPPVKIDTLFWSLASFGFLPIFLPSMLPLIAFQFSSRFLDMMHPIRWTLYYHYGSELSVLLAIATIFSTRKLLAKGVRISIVGLALTLVVLQLLINLVLAAPIKNLAKVDFFREKQFMIDNNLIISELPKDASVSSQNNLIPHFSHREKVYLFPKIDDADYLIFDLHPGQDNWNFYSQDLQRTRALMTGVILDRSYKIVSSAGDTYLLIRQ